MNSAQSLIVPVSHKVLPSATPVGVANDDMKLHPSRSALADDKCKQPEEILLARPVSPANGTVSKVIAQCAGEAAFPYHRFQTIILWTHIDLSLVGPIQGISYLILVDWYLKCPEVIPIKSATIGTVINNLRWDVPKVASRNVTQFSSTGFEDFCCSLNISLLYPSSNFNGLDEYRMTPHVGVQIKMRHRKYLRSLYATISSKAVTEPMVIYLDICCLPLPWNPRTFISPTVTMDSSEDLEKDSR
ncbi:hypothetical protein ACTXT7_009177 [Hymenolepis weldensis]